MLKTNSKQVKETIKKYIIEGFHDCDYESYNNISITEYSDICNTILHAFYIEKVYLDKQHKDEFSLFEEWVSGLCSEIDSSYYYNVCAVNLLGDWLEQTETERNKYSENVAELMITKLLYRELKAHNTKNYKFNDYYSHYSDYVKGV